MASYTEVLDSTGSTVGFIMSLENRGELVADEDSLVDGKLKDKAEYTLKEGGVRFYVDRTKDILSYVSSSAEPHVGRGILTKYGLSIKNLFQFPDKKQGGRRRNRIMKTIRRRRATRHHSRSTRRNRRR